MHLIKTVLLNLFRGDPNAKRIRILQSGLANFILHVFIEGSKMQMPNLTCFTYFLTFLFLNIAYHMRYKKVRKRAYALVDLKDSSSNPR